VSRSRRASKELPDKTPAAVTEETKEPDLAQILREMEKELASDVDKVTTERFTFEQAEIEAQDAKLAADAAADTAAKIEAAAAQMRRFEQMAEQSLKKPDRLTNIRVKRRSKDVEEVAMSLLGASLEPVFKAMDSKGDGTLCHAEVKAALKDSGTLTFTDESLQSILEVHGERVNFEQFKDIAWKASISAAPDIPPTPPRKHAACTTDRATTFIV